MRIAFIGTRGIPATYSGFETFVEQMGARLAERGHDVTVYCRRHHSQERVSRFRGMSLVHIPGIPTKHLDTITHTFVSCLHAATRQYDVVVMCISGNSPLVLIPRATGSKVVLNVDGSDWRRRKWGPIARTYIRASEWLATRLPHATVTDSLVMQRYYRERFGADTHCIAYGADVPLADGSNILERLGLEPRRYLLLVGRLVPENCAHHLVEAFERLHTDMRCVVVGDAPYCDEYIKDLKRSGPNVIFPGYVFGEGYRELMHNAYAFVLCSEVGGTHPVLVEAMAAGNCVVVNDTPANLEVIEDAGLAYRGSEGANGLLGVLDHLLRDPDSTNRFRSAARDRAQKQYSWETVTESYERIFADLVHQTTGRRGDPVLAASDPAD